MCLHSASLRFFNNATLAAQPSDILSHTFFAQPFVKRFAQCYQTVVCLSCLSVCPACLRRWCTVAKLCTVYCGSQLPPKRGTASRPVFGPCLLWPNGWMDYDETWLAGRPRPWPYCVRWGPSSPSPKGQSLSPNFRPISVVAKWLHGTRCHFVGR